MYETVLWSLYYEIFTHKVCMSKLFFFGGGGGGGGECVNQNHWKAYKFFDSGDFDNKK